MRIELGRIGETPRGGLTRLALTDEDKRGRTSGAGHDAQYMAAIGPTGMIFVPSRGGRSHCEEEFTPMDALPGPRSTSPGARDRVPPW